MAVCSAAVNSSMDKGRSHSRSEQCGQKAEAWGQPRSAGTRDRDVAFRGLFGSFLQASELRKGSRLKEPGNMLVVVVKDVAFLGEGKLSKFGHVLPQLVTKNQGSARAQGRADPSQLLAREVPKVEHVGGVDQIDRGQPSQAGGLVSQQREPPRLNRAQPMFP